MDKITINASSSYDVIIGDNILPHLGNRLKEVTHAKKIAIVTDDIVDNLYGSTVENIIKSSGLKTAKFVFKHGEEQKSLSTLSKLYEFLTQNEITRSDAIVALGGGVVGDLAGFAAATYLRGLDIIQIPTTLLAQVDSSIGGKTAVNLTSGKNLVGAFKQPRLVFCDIKTLETLPEDIFSDGMGEVIKYGMIKNKALFETLEQHYIDKNILEVIKCCINVKRNLIEADEFDTGERMLLNFGHTLGHAIEKAYNFTGLSHGSAVGIGMCLITQFAEAKSICPSGTLTRLKECLKKYHLPTEVEFSIKDLIKYCLNDKKRESFNINIIICSDIGTSFCKKMKISEFYDFLEVSDEY